MRIIQASGVLFALIISLSTNAQASAREPVGNQGTHLVEQGDNLLQLSERYGTSVGALAMANGLNSAVINVGQKLIIPGVEWLDNPTSRGTDPEKAMTYVVRKGDYLGLLAGKYDTTVDEIMSASKLASPMIVTNQFLTIPGTTRNEMREDVVEDKVEDRETDAGHAQDNVVEEISDDEMRMRMELSDAGYPYAFSESIEEISRVYAETVSVQADSGNEGSELAASEVVRMYWSYVNEKNYAQSWKLLTEDFRGRVHASDFNDYKQGYVDMALCGVEARRVETDIGQGVEGMIVTSDVTYMTGAQCSEIEIELSLTLELEPASGLWEIDTVAITNVNEDVVLASRPKGGSSKWIDVDIGSQLVTAMEGDRSVRELPVSTGIARYPTITGSFRVYVKHRYADMRGVDLGVPWHLPDVPYVMYFFRGYGLHGTYWHDNFGTPMSHGCINLSVGDAEWLYDFARVGTLVTIHQ